MSIISATITALDGTPPAKGWVEFTVDDTRVGSDGLSIITPRTVIVAINKTTGLMTSPDLDPGPAKVRIVAGDRDATYSIVITEDDADLWELIELYITYDPPVVGAAQSAAADAAAARDETQDILDAAIAEAQDIAEQVASGAGSKIFLDTDDVPYFDPAATGTGVFIAVDTDGAPYLIGA